MKQNRGADPFGNTTTQIPGFGSYGCHDSLYSIARQIPMPLVAQKVKGGGCDSGRCAMTLVE